VNDIKGPLRIGELLVQKGVVSADQVRIALIEQKKRREPLGKILVSLGFATEAIIRDVVGGALGQGSADLSNVVVDGEAIKLIPKEMARRYRILPLTYDVWRLQEITAAMIESIQGGKALSEAMRDFPYVFNTVATLAAFPPPQRIKSVAKRS
jgi:hypothetical protein